MIGTEDTSEQNHHYPESTRSRQPHQTAICSPVVMTRLSCINMMFFFLRRSHCLWVSHFFWADTLALSWNLNVDTWQIQIFSLIKFNLCACWHPWCLADQTSTSSTARWRRRNLMDGFKTEKNLYLTLSIHGCWSSHYPWADSFRQSYQFKPLMMWCSVSSGIDPKMNDLYWCFECPPLHPRYGDGPPRHRKGDAFNRSRSR